MEKYAISPLPSEKDLIIHPSAAIDGIIPKLCTSMLFVGRSGSGKSTLLANLLCRPEFYGRYKSFDRIFLISPTGESDDVQKSLKLPKECIITDLKAAVPFLERIFKTQSELIRDHGAAHCAKVCVIFDDCVSDSRFMATPIFTKMFIACRHANICTMLCSQHYKRVPKVCRLQAHTLYFFAPSGAEVSTIADDFCAPGMTKKQMCVLIEMATEKPYSFLTVDMKKPWENRFSLNLTETFDLAYFKSL